MYCHLYGATSPLARGTRVEISVASSLGLLGRSAKNAGCGKGAGELQVSLACGQKRLGGGPPVTLPRVVAKRDTTSPMTNSARSQHLYNGTESPPEHSVCIGEIELRR